MLGQPWPWRFSIPAPLANVIGTCVRLNCVRLKRMSHCAATFGCLSGSQMSNSLSPTRIVVDAWNYCAFAGRLASEDGQPPGAIFTRRASCKAHFAHPKDAFAWNRFMPANGQCLLSLLIDLPMYPSFRLENMQQTRAFRIKTSVSCKRFCLQKRFDPCAYY